MKPKFEPLDDGLEIIDPIERHRYRLTTHERVDPVPISTDEIPFPVDSTAEISTETITLPSSDLLYIRDQDGLMITEVQPDEQASLPEDQYIIDLSGPMKIYAYVDSTVNVYSDSEHTYISFDDLTAVTIGARSFHTRPAETIVTTSDPSDVMRAVTAFGSALKTTTPERSYPTLRGHPPKIEIGEEFKAPHRLEDRNPTVRIEIPPTLRHIFVISSLAYYLGAEVIPGKRARILTDDGKSHPLDDKNFEESVERVLKKLFFLDCIVRTEGSTPLPLYERQKVEQKLDFDIAHVYSQPLSQQLKTYLEVPFETIESCLPEWRLSVHIEPTTEIIEFLPFIANDLAIVKIQNEDERLTPSSKGQSEAIEEFVRGGVDQPSVKIRSSETHSGGEWQSSTPTVRQTWKLGGNSAVKSTTPLSAYQNNIGRSPREDPIEIKVVCNDPSMREELENVNGVYGTRKELPFDVTIYYDLSIEDLEFILASKSDFLHYIGHIDGDGFQCSDGKLDGASIDSVGMKAFLLNACQSYEQGLHLVNSGSIGGIVTFDEIVNTGAVSVGSIIARLLNRGYPLHAALDVARHKNVIGNQYRLVGNGKTTITQSKTGGPTVCSIDRSKKETRVTINTYTTSWAGNGSIFTPHINSVDKYYLSPRETDQITVSDGELADYLAREQIPVITKTGVRWSKNLAEELF
ncbi:hypothetical protein HTZ84_15520 [Haloterrigena sp. SYSU A558-1]|uniref:CHAT domain-containing protein n=1 Tax=Haloterrigena gelatinilytica TaxID=2741724 RepID=A0ABX2LKR3_9EURY|nr:hypothetical protein [Haloterrigena gelatinilytica]NUC73694.1 hypothetical protein [Haloterrigena gelatinilytica]